MLNFLENKVPFYCSQNAPGKMQGSTDGASQLPDDINFMMNIINDTKFSPIYLYQASSFIGSSNALVEIPYGTGIHNAMSQNIHFRITFYSDPDMEIVVYSAFSLSDQERWYTSINPPTRMTTTGLYIPPGIDGEIVYYLPEVLPPDKTDQQKYHQLSANLEKSLLCGVAYYVRVESYVNNSFETLYNFIYKANCKNISSGNLNPPIEDSNWICSAQGKGDIKISQSDGHCLYSSISSNPFNNIFYISWQNYKKRKINALDYEDTGIYQPTIVNDDGNLYFPSVTYGYWDASVDNFNTSGQFEFDKDVMNSGDFVQTFSTIYSGYDVFFNYFCDTFTGSGII